MGRILPLLALLAAMLLKPDVVYAQADNWLMHGTVKWSSGTAAVSVKLRLLQNNQEKAVTYTSQDGGYGFYNVPGQPGNYTLEVSFNNKVLKTFSPDILGKTVRGGRLDFSLTR
jgi:hypothetical protein